MDLNEFHEIGERVVSKLVDNGLHFHTLKRAENYQAILFKDIDCMGTVCALSWDKDVPKNITLWFNPKYTLDDHEWVKSYVYPPSSLTDVEDDISRDILDMFECYRSIIMTDLEQF